MTKTLQTLELQLAAGELHRWRSARAVELQVLAGRVWVTQSGDEDDHFLAAGDTLALRRGALALIEAEDAARLRLLAPAGVPLQSRAARSRQWLQNWLGSRRPSLLSP
jgi:quercetin dioxygenase-like cupin family protein